MKSTPVSQLMRKVAAYIAGAANRPLPAKVQEKTKHHLLDTIAAIVSGSRLYPGQHGTRWWRRSPTAS